MMKYRGKIFFEQTETNIGTNTGTNVETNTETNMGTNIQINWVQINLNCTSSVLFLKSNMKECCWLTLQSIIIKKHLLILLLWFLQRYLKNWNILPCYRNKIVLGPKSQQKEEFWTNSWFKDERWLDEKISFKKKKLFFILFVFIMSWLTYLVRHPLKLCKVI